MKKTYVLDTNVLLSDTNSIYAFQDNDIIIPMIVLEELDRFKTRQDEVGRNAREISRLFDELRSTGSLIEGVGLPNGGTLKVSHTQDDVMTYLPSELRTKSNDNFIIGFIYDLLKTVPNAIFVSKDINARIKCDSLGIKCQDYLALRKSLGADQLYTGVSVINVDDALVDNFYDNKSIDVSGLSEHSFFENQIVVVKGQQYEGITTKSAITKRRGDQLVPIEKYENVFGLKARNKEQQFSFDLLFDDSIKLVTLSGLAGCGKTLLALAAGLEQLNSVGSYPKYDKLIISRPVQPVGKDIGFLPGTFEEKMAPWISPIRDNLEFLVGGKTPSGLKRRNPNSNMTPMSDEPYLALLQEKRLIEIEAITFIRGRSIPNAFIIIDEAQNLTIHELKTIITRVGEGTKIVLTGDIEQIDNVYVDTYTNGLTYAIEKFKEFSIAGHVTLIKGERSELASLAAKIL